MPTGQTWVDTTLELVASFEVVDETGKPIKIGSVDSAKILASSDDSFSSYKNIVLECGGSVQADKIYVCALVPGQIIISGTPTNCYIHTGESVSLAIDGECC